MMSLSEGRFAMMTLKQARADRLLTVRGLAERANVAPATVYMVESGKSAPSFRVVRALSDALGVDPKEIGEFAAAIESVALGKGTAVALA
jgi:transcriptional regulator with XRE-family HTH domain